MSRLLGNGFLRGFLRPLLYFLRALCTVVFVIWDPLLLGVQTAISGALQFAAAARTNVLSAQVVRSIEATDLALFLI